MAIMMIMVTLVIMTIIHHGDHDDHGDPGEHGDEDDHDVGDNVDKNDQYSNIVQYWKSIQQKQFFGGKYLIFHHVWKGTWHILSSLAQCTMYILVYLPM